MSSGFFDSSNGDRVYSAEDFRELVGIMTNAGVDFGDDGSGFEVTAQSPNAMYVDVAAGGAIINGGWLKTEETTSLAIPTASASYARYDAIVIEFDSTDSNRYIQLKVVQGTASASPSYPTLTQTDTVYQLPIAFVYVGVGVTSIASSNITDVRGNGNYCDWLTANLPPATRTTIGGIRVGSGLNVADDGLLSTTGGGGGGGASYFRDLGDVSVDYLTLESGQVPVYDADEDKWKNETLPEKVIAIVTVDAEEFAGMECVLTNGVDTYAETLDADGVATFDISNAGTYTATVGEEVLSTVEVNLYNILKKPYILYGFKFDATKSDPSQMISYDVQYDGEDVENVGYTPVQMDLSTGVMDAGSWNLTDDFFVPKSCMLNYDGTVAYYLDEDDETKKADGTSSDVANTSFSGNAMMEWGRDGQKIYMKIVPDDTPTNGATFYISNAQVDADFKCLPFYDCNGNEIDHFYTPKYNGSLISSKLRSISGQTPCNTQTGSTEATAAAANNVNSVTEWDTEVLADRMLINSLLLMLGKNANTQAVYGQGYTTGGSAASSLASTGTLNGKGQWYGSSTNSSASKGVKVFGMEHWWGNIWRRTRGLVNISGTIKYKMTYSTVDGSSVTGYNDTGSGYLTVSNGTPGGTSGGYISAAVFNAEGIFAKTASGSETTYFCDGLWFNNSQSNYALLGGACGTGSFCGAFAVTLGNTFSGSDWDIGASLSCKPLAA